MPLPTRSLSHRVRKLHRYLGLFIGIQFLLWTAGGLYFSWTDLDEIHGDHLRVPRPRLRADGALVSPSQVLDAIRRGEPVDSLASVELVRVMDAPVYRLAYFTRTPEGARRRVRLADARTGALRPPVSRDEAIRMARAEFAHAVPLRAVEYLTPATVGKHHEYREQPLPAWAVSFNHPSGATAYVGAETGTVVRVRHGQWRTFDFLWMLHTMDYRGRDDFNNMVLRAFSILGLLTISSGFVLFWLTSRPYLNRARRKGKAVEPAS